jgi:aspartyl-tRNA(Asn)/glutamyl-tRNA(Gln) amidotransferase subunit A
MNEAHLHDLGAIDIQRRYRSKELSPVEVARAVLKHIAACEPQLHATYALDAEASA